MKLLTWALMAVTATSCAPLIPTIQENENGADPVAIVESEKLRLDVAHLGASKGFQAFYVSITNNSPDTLMIFPEDAFYLHHKSLSPSGMAMKMISIGLSHTLCCQAGAFMPTTERRWLESLIKISKLRV